jgi:hypothetical protein
MNNFDKDIGNGPNMNELGLGLTPNPDQFNNSQLSNT